MKEFASVFAQSALRTYMSAEGLARHHQFPAKIGDLRYKRSDLQLKYAATYA